MQTIGVVLGILLGGAGGAAGIWLLRRIGNGRRRPAPAPVPTEDAAAVVAVEVRHTEATQQIAAERAELAKVSPDNLQGSADAFNDAMGL